MKKIGKTKAQLIEELALLHRQLAELEALKKGHKQSKDMLYESEKRYRGILDNMLEGCQIIGFDWRYLYLNDVAAIHGHRPKEELLGHTMLEMYPGIENTEMFAEIRRCMEKRTMHRMENEFIFPDGSKGCFELSIEPVPEGILILSRDITERKQAEEKLAEVRELFRSTFHISPLPSVLTKLPQRTVVDVNAAFEELFGYRRMETIGRSIADFNLWADSSEREGVAEVLLKSGSVRDYEFVFKTKSGRTGYGVFFAEVIEQPRDKYVLTKIVDITERKQAEERIRDSEDKFRQLVQNMSSGVVVYQARDGGSDFIIKDFNRAAENMEHVKKEDILGKSVLEVFPGVRDFGLFEVFQRVWRTGKPEHHPISLYKDQRIAGWRENYVYKLPTGEVVAVYDDVTERKKTEETIKQQLAEITSYYDNAPIGLAILDTELRFLRINNALAEINGIPAAEHIGKTIKDTVPALEPQAREITSKIIRTGEAVTGMEFTGETKAQPGVERTWLESWHALKDDNKRIIGFAVMVQEITERKKADEELKKYREHLEELVRERTSELEQKTTELEQANIRLQELDRLKSVFLASMSHELRTPLNSIIGFTGIMLQGMVGELNGEQRKQLMIVKSSASHLLNLINDVLDISKIEAGSVELSLEEFRLDDVVSEVVDGFSTAVSEKGLELVTEVPETAVLFSDERRVKQVLMNLVSNAVKFTDQGTVKIAARVLKEGKLEICVSDTGAGIKEEDMSRLFEPFQQVDMSLRKRHEGTGLGLYLARKLADLLGGDISAKSRYGKGSEFTFTMPLEYKDDVNPPPLKGEEM